MGAGAEERELPAARLVRRLGQAWVGLQDGLETSVYPSYMANPTAIT